MAYYVGDAAEAGELRRHLRERLQEHMRPAAFLRLEKLPLAPTGKKDRRALPAPDSVRAAEEPVAPRTPVEETLAGLYAQALGLRRVGVHEHFFEAGGGSLLATQLVAHVRRSFGVDVPLRKLFELPSVAELAPHVEELLIEQMESLTEEEAQQLLNEGP